MQVSLAPQLSPDVECLGQQLLRPAHASDHKAACARLKHELGSGRGIRLGVLVASHVEVAQATGRICLRRTRVQDRGQSSNTGSMELQPRALNAILTHLDACDY